MAALPSLASRHLPRAWPLLGRLRELLRTERNVRLAVLFGSRARGDHRSDSDVDLRVTLDDDSVSRRLDLESRLEAALGVPVQVVTVADGSADPALLAEAIEDGRVIADRRRQWPRLKRRYPEPARAAAAADRERRESARAAVAEFWSRTA